MHTRGVSETSSPQRRSVPLMRLAAGSVLLFVALAIINWHRTIPLGLDRTLASKIGASGHGFGFKLGEAISSVGSPVGGAIVAVTVAAFIWWRSRDVLTAAAVVAAPAIAGTLQVVAKAIVQRPRPTTGMLTGEYGYGFPSGHMSGFAALAAIVSILIIVRAIPTHRSALIVGLAITSATAIAASRLMVGAHYLTDVIAGSVFGLAVAIAVAMIALSPNVRAWISHRLRFVAGAVQSRSVVWPSEPSEKAR